MVYKLLDNNTAILTTRQPKIAHKELNFEFLCAPEDATAVIDISGNLIYRNLKKGKITIPSSKLRGNIKMTIAILNGTVTPKSWTCDALKADLLQVQIVRINKYASILQQTIVDLRLENEDFRKENREINKKLASLEKKLDNLMNGHNFI